MYESALKASHAPPNRIRTRVRGLLGRHYYSNRSPIQKWRRERYRTDAQQALKREQGLYEIVSRSLDLLEIDPEQPHKKHVDALFILNMMNTVRPKTVLECGTGLSTTIFAYCLHKLWPGEGLVHALDEHEVYLNTAVVPAIPDHLKRYVNPICSPTTHRYYYNAKGGALGVFYEDVPKVQFDLVFVDGPAFYRHGRYRLKAGPELELRAIRPFNADLLNVMMNADRQVFAAIDQRIDTIWNLADLAGCSLRYDVKSMKATGWLGPDQFSEVKCAEVDVIDPGVPPKALAA